ncbi:thiamine-phosphate kinase [Cryptosporangium aurantiacum]|uniref:Thiamine-monophosphate kinase n=1 Tax=Cryptosporangium aurantiacum TaxID=134849 RepID=A0A1M7HR46_9ACTN|nr:thiamine-phosphate kinase [Cryptosporangium aurantiacum]SHM31032.1 thiamine-phosphate kinase [Cryptosporangium aurantiacum]
MTVSDIGEAGLLERVFPRLPQSRATLLGPGDDAALVAVRGGRVVATTDLLVEGRHFRLDWSSPRDVGRKAAAQNLADVAAMGGVGTALLIGLALPGDTEVSWAEAFYDGLREECDLVGAGIVGGDVVRSEHGITIAVTALGSMRGREPVTRSGAKPGDVVAIAGRVGWSAAGLAVLSRGFRTPRALVDAHRFPQVPYAAGPVAADLGATAMCDVSDGLVADLRSIAVASGVSIEITTDVLEVTAQMRDAALALGVDPVRWLLDGGEDHALIATFPPRVDLPEKWLTIGRVVRGRGVYVDGQPSADQGFDHFR